MNKGDEIKVSLEIADAAVAEEGLRRRLMAYMEKLSQYVRIHDPDKDKLSELVVKAKGPKRSMRKFAEEIGVNPSTLSRLVNQKTAGASTDKLIAEIAAHADPESGVTFEELMEAHGLALKDKRFRSDSAFEETCHRIIEDELMRRGYAVEDSIAERFTGAGFGMQYDFALQTNALKKEKGKWYFDCKMSLGRPGGMPVGSGRTMQWLTMTMALFYCGSIDAERVSIVVDRREIFEQLKRRCRTVTIPDEISITLVDINEMRVADEYVLNKKEGTGVTIFNDIVDTGEGKTDYTWDMSVFNED